MANRGTEETLAVQRTALIMALDNAKLTATHWKVWLLSAMGVFLDGFDLFIMAVALPLIAQDFQPSPATLGLIGASALLGAVVGAAVLGRVCDRYGRKTIYVVDLALFIVFTALCALAWNPLALIVFRFLLGVGIGADYPISASYIVEFMPARLRGRMLVSGFSFQALGSLTGAGVGLLILIVYPHEDAWRWMLPAGIVPAVLTMLVRTTLPESPRWCMVHGRWEEAEEAVSQVVGRALVVETLTAVAQQGAATVGVQMARVATGLEAAARPRTNYRALFSPALLHRTVLATVPWFLMDICLYGVGFFTPTILAAMAFAGRGDFISQDIASTEGAVFLDIFLVIGFALAIWLIDRWGRLRLQLLGFAGMTAGLLILATTGLLPGGSERNVAVVFLGFALFNVMVNMGPNSTTYLLPAELFPTELRASAHGLAAAAGKVGAAVGVFFLPVLKDAWGLGATLLVVAAAGVLGLLVTHLFGIETRGESLEQLAGGETPATAPAGA